MRGAKAWHKCHSRPCHSSSLYNLVLNNTVIIIYKLMFLSVNTDCASSPILCYHNVHFGYKTLDASNPILTEKKNHWTDIFFVCKNANGLLVYAVYIYTVSMFLLFLCMQVNLKKNHSFLTIQVIFCEKKAGTSSLFSLKMIRVLCNRKHDSRKPQWSGS